LKICFVVDTWAKTKGGAELQSYLIAKGLKTKGWDVSYITLTPAESRIFHSYHAPMRFQGHGGLARYSRALSLLRILRMVDPEIVFLTYAGSLSGFATAYGIIYRKKIAFRAASVLDADLALGGGSSVHGRGLPARMLHLLTVRKCHALVVNAQYIEKEFHKHLPSKNIWTIPNGLEIEPLHKGTASHVLWIGRFDKVKGPSVYLRLAQELPHIRFLMYGWGPLRDQLASEAKRILNLSLMDKIIGETKRRAFRNSFAFINTSIAEGFPNTLLEAGMHGVPYVSFVDPDEIICKYRLGFHVRSFRELVEKTRLLATDSRLRNETGSNIRSYVEGNHNIENTVSAYDVLLRSLLRDI